MARLRRSEWLYLFGILVCFSQLTYKVDAVECEYCHNDFKSLGRHVWRCKQIVLLDNVGIVENNSNADIPEQIEIPERSLANNNGIIEPTNDPPDIRTDEENVNEEFICYCGRVCKGLRGLQAHKRACRILDIPDMKALFEEPLRINEVEDNEPEVNDDEHETMEKNLKLNGVKLPTSKDDWNLANDHFKETFPYADEISNIDEYVHNFQQAIYSYFHDTYGSATNTSLDENCREFDRYKDMSNHLRSIKSVFSFSKIVQY